MQNLEMNKIAAAILLAGVIGMSISIVTESLHGGHEGGEHEAKRGYTIEGAETAAAETGAVAPDSGPVDILPYLQTVDLKAGEALVKRCTSCHSFEKGGPNKVGPNQWGVVGSHHAHKDDYTYSDALKAMHEKKWGLQEMSDFLQNPKKYAAGTKMAFAGIKKPEERANLIAYINTLSDSPLPIPKVDPAAAKPAEPAAAPADGATPPAAPTTPAAPAASGPVDILPFMKTADLKLGEQLIKRCTSCHSFDKGGPNRVGPNQWGVVGGGYGHAEGFNYSDVIKAQHGKKNWDFQELSNFLENPKKYLPGTRMAFAGLKKPEERAALIAYMNTLSDKPLPIK